MPLLCASLHTGNWESKLNQLSPCRTYCQQHWTSRRNCYNSQWINNWGSLTRHWPILDRSAQLSSRYNCLFLSTLQWIINEIYPSSVGIGNASRISNILNQFKSTMKYPRSTLWIEFPEKKQNGLTTQIDYYLFIVCLSFWSSCFPISPPTIHEINTREFRFGTGIAENRNRISIDDTHKLRWKRVKEIRSRVDRNVNIHKMALNP